MKKEVINSEIVRDNIDSERMPEIELVRKLEKKFGIERRYARASVHLAILHKRIRRKGDYVERAEKKYGSSPTRWEDK